MLLAKINLNLRNSLLLHHGKLFSLPQTARALATSNFLSKKSENQAAPTLLKLYTGPLAGNIRAIKLFSLCSSALAISCQPIIIEQTSKMQTSMPVIFAICGVIGFFTFVTPVLIHLVAKKYVTELNYDPATKEYIATVLTFFLLKKHIRFTPADVDIPEVPGMFTSFLVKEKKSGKSLPIFIDPNFFDDPSHYVKIMGFDKPIDFKLNLSENDKTEKK